MYLVSFDFIALQNSAIPLYKLEHHSMLRLAFLHCLTISLIVGGLGVEDHTNILLEALAFLCAICKPADTY